MRLIPLRSSLLASVGYDMATETMVVMFQTGGGTLYKYTGVPVETYAEIVSDSGSHGKAFNRLVRNNKDIPYKQVDQEHVRGL